MAAGVLIVALLSAAGRIGGLVRIDQQPHHVKACRSVVLMGDITPAIHDCSGVYHMEPAEQRGKFFYRSEEGNCKIERSATIPVANPQEQEPVTWTVGHEWKSTYTMKAEDDQEVGSDVTQVRGWKIIKKATGEFVPDATIRFDCLPAGSLQDYRPSVKLIGGTVMKVPMSDDLNAQFADPGAGCEPPKKWPPGTKGTPQMLITTRGPNIDMGFPGIFQMRYKCFIAGGGIPSLETVRTIQVGLQAYAPCNTVTLMRQGTKFAHKMTFIKLPQVDNGMIVYKMKDRDPYGRNWLYYSPVTEEWRAGVKLPKSMKQAASWSRSSLKYVLSLSSLESFPEQIGMEKWHHFDMRTQRWNGAWYTMKCVGTSS